MLDLTIAAAPHREVKALRRGVFHNSRRLDNGNWTWRYDAIRAVPDFRVYGTTSTPCPRPSPGARGLVGLRHRRGTRPN